MSGNSDLKNVDVANDPVVALPGESRVASVQPSLFHSVPLVEFFCCCLFYELPPLICFVNVLLRFIWSVLTVLSHHAVKKLSASASTFVPGAGFGGGKDIDIEIKQDDKLGSQEIREVYML